MSGDVTGRGSLIAAPHNTPLRDPEAHELKTWPIYFDAVADGRKTFEVRKADRDFQVGDTLILNAWKPDWGYTGASLMRQITYVLPGGQFGIEDGYCVLGIA